MSFLNDFDAVLEFEVTDDLSSLAILDLIDTALDDLKHQRIVDTNKVTNWLLDIRNLVQ